MLGEGAARDEAIAVLKMMDEHTAKVVDYHKSLNLPDDRSKLIEDACEGMDVQ